MAPEEYTELKRLHNLVNSEFNYNQKSQIHQITNHYNNDTTTITTNALLVCLPSFKKIKKSLHSMQFNEQLALCFTAPLHGGDPFMRAFEQIVDWKSFILNLGYIAKPSSIHKHASSQVSQQQKVTIFDPVLNQSTKYSSYSLLSKAMNEYMLELEQLSTRITSIVDNYPYKINLKDLYKVEPELQMLVARCDAISSMLYNRVVIISGSGENNINSQFSCIQFVNFLLKPSDIMLLGQNNEMTFKQFYEQQQQQEQSINNSQNLNLKLPLIAVLAMNNQHMKQQHHNDNDKALFSKALELYLLDYLPSPIESQLHHWKPKGVCMDFTQQLHKHLHPQQQKQQKQLVYVPIELCQLLRPDKHLLSLYTDKIQSTLLQHVKDSVQHLNKLESSSSCILNNSIGYKFKNKFLLQAAFTHTSAVNSNLQVSSSSSSSSSANLSLSSYETLELLGDSILDCLCSIFLYHNYYYQNNISNSNNTPLLVQLKQQITSNSYLYDTIVRQFPQWKNLIVMQKSYYQQQTQQQNNNSCVNKKIVADSFEALIGAVFVDSFCFSNLSNSASNNAAFETVSKLCEAIVFNEFFISNNSGNVADLLSKNNNGNNGKQKYLDFSKK